MLYFILLLAAFGLCFGFQNKITLVYSKGYLETGEPVTFLDKLFHCTYCLGFHCGWMTWLAFWGVTGDVMQFGSEAVLSEGLSLFLWCFTVAAWCYIVDVTTKKLEG